MTAQEAIEFIKALKQSGVSHCKFGEIDVSFEAAMTWRQEEPAPQIPVDAPVEVSPEIKHKVEELSSLLKLSDNELVDQLFPDKREEIEQESA